MFLTIDNNERRVKFNFQRRKAISTFANEDAGSNVVRFRRGKLKWMRHRLEREREKRSDNVDASARVLFLGNAKNIEVKTFLLTYCCLQLIGYTSNRVSRCLLSLARFKRTRRLFAHTVKLITIFFSFLLYT